MAQMIANAIRQAGTNFVDSLATFLPRMVTTLAIILVGWLIAMLLRALVRVVLGWVRINVAAERFGVAPLLRTADLPPADALVGAIVFWLVWIGFLLSGIDVLGFESCRGWSRVSGHSCRGCCVAVVILDHRLRRRELRVARHAAGRGQRPRAVSSPVERCSAVADPHPDRARWRSSRSPSRDGRADGVCHCVWGGQPGGGHRLRHRRRRDRQADSRASVSRTASGRALTRYLI